MACRISCGMIHSGVAIAIVLAGAAGCRGDASAPSEPPRDVGAAEAGAGEAKAREAEPSAQGTQTTETKEASVTTTPPTPEPAGPPLSTEAVVPQFQRWWKTWSVDAMAGHPLKARVDELVAAGGTVKAEACDVLADHVTERAPMGSAELLFGDPAALRGRGDRCWWVHHDGMLSAGLGAALASDGRVLAVWVVLEG
jgi:hypothetical protein